MTAAEFYALVDARRGHFLLESGLHAEQWLDLDQLFADQRRIAPFVAELADELRALELDAICGALVGGAFLGQQLAKSLDLEFCYTQLKALETNDQLFRAQYELPNGFVTRVRGKRAAIVDDVMSAGSALRGTYAALRTNEAHVVVAGALLVLGDIGMEFFAAEKVPVVFGARDEFRTWTPGDCPLCASGVPLERPSQMPT